MPTAGLGTRGGLDRGRIPPTYYQVGTPHSPRSKSAGRTMLQLQKVLVVSRVLQSSPVEGGLLPLYALSAPSVHIVPLSVHRPHYATLSLRYFVAALCAARSSRQRWVDFLLTRFDRR